MEYVRRPDFDGRRLQLMIEEDPALSAKVLRVANSAAFAGSQPVASIRDAAVRLGARAISDVTASIAAMAMFQDVKGQGRTVRDHMVATAMVMRVLSSRNESAAPAAYITGLLHDLGKLLLLQTEDASYEELLSKSSSPDETHLRERELLGYDHAVLAGHTLKQWGLPDPIPRIVAWHHQPSRAYEEGGEVGVTVALLRVADQLEPMFRRVEPPPGAAKLKRLCDGPDFSSAGIGARQLDGPVARAGRRPPRRAAAVLADNKFGTLKGSRAPRDELGAAKPRFAPRARPSSCAPGTPTRPGRSPGRPGPARSSAGGCTWRRGRCGPASRS